MRVANHVSGTTAHLSGDCDLILVGVPNRTSLLVRVVEHDRHGRLAQANDTSQRQRWDVSKHRVQASDEEETMGNARCDVSEPRAHAETGT